MRLAIVLQVRCAVSDVAVDDDESGSVVGLLERGERLGQRLQVIGIGYLGDAPAVGFEARSDILGECEGGRPVDADLVVVVDPAEVAELEVAGQRGRLGGDPLHHASDAGQGVDVPGAY